MWGVGCGVWGRKPLSSVGVKIFSSGLICRVSGDEKKAAKKRSLIPQGKHLP
ncbi:hypothetical protein [Microcystis aeruginosa]|uniref:hypothetical protein n=1 Tax=Microcystis aeruginosa TaxID=1126 RepID=UPI001E60C094|nr:hypothetical protein [Microcystis aeruginosa]